MNFFIALEALKVVFHQLFFHRQMSDKIKGMSQKLRHAFLM